MPAIAFSDFEENITLLSIEPEYLKANHFFVKLIHRVKVFDVDRYFAQTFDTAI
jgi:hypothetical protein